MKSETILTVAYELLGQRLDLKEIIFPRTTSGIDSEYVIGDVTLALVRSIDKNVGNSLILLGKNSQAPLIHTSDSGFKIPSGRFAKYFIGKRFQEPEELALYLELIIRTEFCLEYYDYQEHWQSNRPNLCQQ